jgi:hypothetical protein
MPDPEPAPAIGNPDPAHDARAAHRVDAVMTQAGLSPLDTTAPDDATQRDG